MGNIVVVEKSQLAEPDPLMEAAQEELELLEADAEAAKADFDPNDPYGWLVPWYQRQHLQCDTLEQVELAALDAAKERVKAEYRTRRKVLDYKWGEEARRQVDATVRAKKGKAKSVNYPFGRAGFRQVGGKDTVVITDEAAAIRDAKAKSLAGVVKTTETLSKTAILKHLEGGVSIVGAHKETTPRREVCYVGTHVLGGKELLEPDPTPALPQKMNADAFFEEPDF